VRDLTWPPSPKGAPAFCRRGTCRKPGSRGSLVVQSTLETPRGSVHPGNSSWSSPPRELLVVQSTPGTPRGPVHPGNSSWSSPPRELLVEAACDLVLGLPGIRTSASSELGRAPYQRLQHMPWTGVGARHHTPFQLRPECPVIAASFHSRPRVRRLGGRPDRDAVARPALARPPPWSSPSVTAVAPPVRDGGAGAFAAGEGSRIERAPRAWGKRGGGGSARGASGGGATPHGVVANAARGANDAAAAGVAVLRIEVGRPHGCGRWHTPPRTPRPPSGTSPPARPRAHPRGHTGVPRAARKRGAARHTTPAARPLPSTREAASVGYEVSTRRPVATRGRVTTATSGGGGAQRTPRRFLIVAAALCLVPYLTACIWRCTWSSNCQSLSQVCQHLCCQCMLAQWRFRVE